MTVSNFQVKELYALVNVRPLQKFRAWAAGGELFGSRGCGHGTSTNYESWPQRLIVTHETIVGVIDATLYEIWGKRVCAERPGIALDSPSGINRNPQAHLPFSENIQVHLEPLLSAKLGVVPPVRRFRRLNMGSTADKITGLSNEAVGKVKQEAGKVVGSDSLKVEGAVQEAKGAAQKAIGDAKAANQEAAKKVADFVNKKL